LEQQTALVSEYLSTVASGNLSVMFLDGNVDPIEVCGKYPQLTEVQVVDDSYKGNEVVNLYLEMKPDAVFVNLKKTRNDTIYALGKIRELSPNAKIISIS